MAITQARMLALIEGMEELDAKLSQILADLNDFAGEEKSCREFVEYLLLSGLSQRPAEAIATMRLERAHYNRTASANVDNRERARRYRNGAPTPPKLTRAKFAGTLPEQDPKDAKVPEPSPRRKGHFHGVSQMMTRDEAKLVPQQYVDALRGAKSPEEAAAERALRAFQEEHRVWDPADTSDDDLPF